MLFPISFCLGAFSHPVFFPSLAILGSTLPLALFWFALFRKERAKKQVFYFSTLWFSSIAAVQLSWMTSWEYQGAYIFLIYAFFSLLIGIQFGLLTVVLSYLKDQPAAAIGFLPPFWVFFEWSRLFWFSGFTWNYLGLALTGSSHLLQLASLGGIYFLSYLVVLFNLLFFFFLRAKRVSFASIAVVLLVGGFAYGEFRRDVSYDQKESSPLRSLLFFSREPPNAFIGFTHFQNYASYSFRKWKRTFQILNRHSLEDIDLMVFPEAYFPFSSNLPIYPFESVKRLFLDELGIVLPNDLENHPHAEAFWLEDKKVWVVSNGYLFSALANYFHLDIVAGLETSEAGKHKQHFYNAAIHFASTGEEEWYAKRKLLPVAEYFPFEFVRPLARYYGIEDAFSPGKEPRVFHKGGIRLAPSVCYEETYPHLLWENSKLGADALVNVSNDVWFPSSYLGEVHFAIAKIRAVELGLPLLRSCNLGVTAAVDSLGKEIARMGKAFDPVDDAIEALSVQVEIKSMETLFSKVGDRGILLGSLLQGGLALLFILRGSRDRH